MFPENSILIAIGGGALKSKFQSPLADGLPTGGVGLAGKCRENAGVEDAEGAEGA